MKATIYQDTEYEISWSIEHDPITPELIDRIEEAGRELDIDWSKNEFYPAVELLLDHYSVEEIKAKIFDEDPDLIDLITLAIQNPLDEPNDSFRTFVRLYLPVVMIILRNYDTIAS